MMAWLTMNICLSVITLTTVVLLRRAPARLGFYLLVGVLVCWCLPLTPWVIRIGPPTLQNLDLIPIGAGVETTPLVATPTIASLPFIWLLFGAASIGLTVFAFRVIRSSQQVKPMRAGATPLNPEHWAFLKTERIPETWIIDGNNAFTTGLFKPSIWVGQTCLNSTAAQPILTHEWIHAARRDNLWLFLIELIRHGLWWNPIVWVLAHEARLKLEMSCDEACEQRFDSGVYLKEITSFFTGDGPGSRLTSTSAAGTQSALLKRARHLLTRKPLGRAQGSVLVAAALATATVLVQAEGNPNSSSISSLEIQDNGSYRLTLDNAHPGDAIQRLASLGGYHVLAHPGTNDWQLTAVIEGTRDRWFIGVRELLNSSSFGESYDYAINHGALLLAPKTVLAAGDGSWLTNALQMDVLMPPPNDVEAKRIAVDVEIKHGDASFRQSGLVLSEKAWFALSQASIGLNIRPTVLDDNQIMLQMRIDDTNSGEVLSSPTLITLAGKKAFVNVGDSLSVEVAPSIL